MVNNDFDQRLRDRLEGVTEPAPEVWEGISKGLERRRRKVLFRRFTVAAATEHGDWAYPFPDDEPRRSCVFTYCILQALGCTPEGVFTGTVPADADGDGALTLGEVAEYTRALHEELRDTLPEDFPFQIFQFYGEEDTVLFRR